MSPTFARLFNDTAVQARLADGIAQHRQTVTTVQVTDSKGCPLAGVPVQVQQLSSAFLFGTNLFMLGSYPTAALNAGYEAAITGLCNAGSVPFYWRDLEPTPGELRFAASSRPIPRRPPPDAVVAWCQQHQLNMNGHCLVWDNARHSVPPWLADPAHCEAILERRIHQIAERYGRSIPRWDVLNEPLNRNGALDNPNHPVFPDNYERLVFKWAAQCFPPSAHLMLNETTGAAWIPEHRARFHTLLQRLLADGAKIDGIGLQWHLFSHAEQQRVLDGHWLQPAAMLQALDEFHAYGLPVHISEITLHAFANDAAGQAAQAELATAVYRLWFSHPAVHAITWWNFPDGGAVVGEDGLASGLVHRDMSPKPAYTALWDLIQREWRTQLSGRTDAAGTFSFRGFHGTHRVTAGQTTQTITIAVGAPGTHTLATRDSA